VPDRKEGGHRDTNGVPKGKGASGRDRAHTTGKK